MLLRRIRYNPQTSINIKLRTRSIIVDLTKLFLRFVLIYIFLSALYKIYFLDIENKYVVVFESSYNLLNCIGFYSYIYFSVIIGFILSITALLIFLLFFFLYGATFLSSGLIAIVISISIMVYYTFIKHKYFDSTPFNR